MSASLPDEAPGDVMLAPHCITYFQACSALLHVSFKDSSQQNSLTLHRMMFSLTQDNFLSEVMLALGGNNLQ